MINTTNFLFIFVMFLFSTESYSGMRLFFLILLFLIGYCVAAIEPLGCKRPHLWWHAPLVTMRAFGFQVLESTHRRQKSKHTAWIVFREPSLSPTMRDSFLSPVSPGNPVLLPEADKCWKVVCGVVNSLSWLWLSPSRHFLDYSRHRSLGSRKVVIL